MKHYIGMNGSFGCLPDYCASYDSRQDAIADLTVNLDLTDEQIDALRCNGIVGCTPDQGAAYASITTCNCGEPEVHNDI